MIDAITVSEAARLLGAKPRDISDLFYSRELSDDLAPIVGGRRLIPRKILPTIRWALKRNGRRVSEPGADRDPATTGNRFEVGEKTNGTELADGNS